MWTLFSVTFGTLESHDGATSQVGASDGLQLFLDRFDDHTAL